MKTALLTICVCLAACSQQDWRAQAIANAEQNIKDDVGDPSAQFSRVQVTGDDSTGQTCGFVTAKSSGNAPAQATRFIVYIDNTAGPYVESGIGTHPLTSSDFENAWQSDCLREGYKS
ncbi:MAG: hypothetical protein WBQ17_15005 [Rhizomicrobium sp.]